MWGPMNSNQKLGLFLCISLMMTTSCSNSDTGGGGIALTVKNAKHPAAISIDNLPEVLQVKSFHVVVSGEGFEPIESSFSADSSYGVVSGIPVGDDRTIMIEALNNSGQAIRRRTLKGLTVVAGNPTPVVATLVSLPVITNFQDGSLVTQTHLIFKGYGEPAGSVEVSDSNQSSFILTDMSTSSTLISPSLSDGSFSFTPSLLPIGTHTFTFHDPESGEFTQLTLTLVKPGSRPGFGLSSAGAVSKSFGMSLGMMGQFQEVMMQEK